MKNNTIIELTPDWQQVFELAKGLVRDSIPEDRGRETVLQMLDYGKRLDNLRSSKEVPNA
jgi:hypothetical protein